MWDLPGPEMKLPPIALQGGLLTTGPPGKPILQFSVLYWFCHTSTWFCHGCTRVPNPESSSHLPPRTSLWVIPVHQPQASSIVHRTWTGNSFLIWYYTCFNAFLPNHPTLSLSHRVQKTVLYICVSFAISHTRLLLPSF